MKKLIMLSVFALGTITANANYGLVYKINNKSTTKLDEQFEFGCYRIIASTNYFVNYGLINSTQVTTYNIFVSIADVNAHIQNLKNENPDTLHDGTGEKTIYTYSKVSNSNCLSLG